MENILGDDYQHVPDYISDSDSDAEARQHISPLKASKATLDVPVPSLFRQIFSEGVTLHTHQLVAGSIVNTALAMASFELDGVPRAPTPPRRARDPDDALHETPIPVPSSPSPSQRRLSGASDSETPRSILRSPTLSHDPSKHSVHFGVAEFSSMVLEDGGGAGLPCDDDSAEGCRAMMALSLGAHVASVAREVGLDMDHDRLRKQIGVFVHSLKVSGDRLPDLDVDMWRRLTALHLLLFSDIPEPESQLFLDATHAEKAALQGLTGLTDAEYAAVCDVFLG